jgi:hypothetical protein
MIPASSNLAEILQIFLPPDLATDRKYTKNIAQNSVE